MTLQTLLRGGRTMASGALLGICCLVLLSVSSADEASGEGQPTAAADESSDDTSNEGAPGGNADDNQAGVAAPAVDTDEPAATSAPPQTDAPATETPTADSPGGTATTQASTPEGEGTIDNAVTNQQPAFFVRASLNREVRDYREGDTLAIKVCCEVDAYLYVLYQQADGKVYQIFPNESQKDNRIAAKQEIQVPGVNDFFRWEIGPPFGKEVVKVIACRQPVKGLSGKELQRERFNVVSKGTVKSTIAELAGANPADWAETDLELRTHGAGDAPIDENARRVGVFFGISNYEFNEEHMAGYKLLIKEEDRTGDGHLNLTYSHFDAIDLGATLKEIGRLSDVEVCTDEKVTKKNMERLITKWLPSITRPGDTVVIFFSAHGGQISDDNNDERDNQDEVLIPYDTIDLLTLMQLLELKKQGQLKPELESRVQELTDVALAAGDRPSAQNEALVRYTGVSDDLFGRWLQRLSGRQVIVILDACHSGGFANQEKGAGKSAPRQPNFDFLDGELVRLKDIGQPEHAMLAACTADESALELADGTKNSVLTGYVLKCLREISGPIRVEDAQEYCQEHLPEYFEELNKWRAEQGYQPATPHHSYLISNCTRPLYLKP
ncbi:MAG: DUF4384 domain-containing protein [Pirellulales bacterium]|nr:DUF4384 domain-containing protein [Pirellulales bacterium]